MLLAIGSVPGGLLVAVIAVTVVLAALLVIGLRYDDRDDEPAWWREFEREFDQYVEGRTRG